MHIRRNQYDIDVGGARGWQTAGKLSPLPNGLAIAPI